MKGLILACLLPFGFVSCRADVTPAVKGVMLMEEAGLNAYASVRGLLENAQGLDPALKAKILADIAGEEAKFLAIASEVKRNLESMGVTNWFDIAKQTYELYLKIKTENE